MASSNIPDDLASDKTNLDLNRDNDFKNVTSGIGNLEFNPAQSFQDVPGTPDGPAESTDTEEQGQESEEDEANHSTIPDRHNRAIAQILSHFRNMVMAATAPISQHGNILELAALNRMTMETECAALISEIQGLLAINREIKALWIRGPIRNPGDDSTREAQLDQQAADVARLYDSAIQFREEAIRKENAAKAGASAAGGDGGGGGAPREEGKEMKVEVEKGKGKGVAESPNTDGDSESMSFSSSTEF
ncbi:hypothetical protein F5Y11DRAFT_365122 [Daldinia sp. FL1419]|nr:hypothetical protein F5Y11DRAFT_365122 [Daldinia sp. FL1419]